MLCLCRQSSEISIVCLQSSLPTQVKQWWTSLCDTGLVHSMLHATCYVLHAACPRRQVCPLSWFDRAAM